MRNKNDIIICHCGKVHTEMEKYGTYNFSILLLIGSLWLYLMCVAAAGQLVIIQLSEV